MSDFSEHTDIVVVGGGPVGLAAAIALRGKGFRVTVADPARPPIDKTCGEGLMPGTLASLERLGVTFPFAEGFPFRGIRFHGPGASVDASFPNGTGYGIRRPILHQVLIDRAAECGATLLWNTRVVGLTATGVETDRGKLACRYIVGADGGDSRVRRWAGLDGVRSEARRYGFRRHYRVAPWTDCMEIYWGSRSQVYVTPVSREEVCVVVISRNSHMRLDHVLPHFPILAARLSAASTISQERGAMTATRRLRRVWSDRVALIGDASGSVDAITGEGLRLGFEQAVVLAESLEKGSLEAYGVTHGRLARRPTFMANLMLTMDRSDWLRHRVFQAFSDAPEIFAAQLDMHSGASNTAEFFRRSMLPLGRRILFS
jgi:flavin-dependent dehydrogenase